MNQVGSTVKNSQNKLTPEKVELFKSIARSIATHGWNSDQNKFTEDQKAWCCGLLIKHLSEDWVKDIFRACKEGLESGNEKLIEKKLSEILDKKK